MPKKSESDFANKLIKTIDDTEEVENFSEDSDAEIQFQPSKQKKKSNSNFDSNFEFVTSVEEYNKNTWNDLHKYIKRKASTKTDDKIKKLRHDIDPNDDLNQTIQESAAADYLSDNSLSSEDLQHDRIRNKPKKKKKSEQPVDAEEVYSYDESLNFYQMNLSRPLLKAIDQMRFIQPTPIQAATIPVALLGKDIYGCAATGTGKTAAYMLPSLERLIFRPKSATATRVLVLVPTRELGVQVYQVTKQLCQYTDIQIALAVGGLDLKAQETMLRKNPDIVVATPGRLIDHLQSTPTFDLNSIEILILDEADRILDEYFAEQMKEIIKQCSFTRQTMLFSATMTNEVDALAAVSLNNPTRIFVDSNKVVAFNLRQEFIRIRSDNEGDREAILAALVCRTFRDHCMIFVQTKKQAHRLHILLGLLGVKIAELHGNLTQPQRLEALQKFKQEEVDVIVATDVAARGLDVPGIKTVINFVMPATLQHYIHRVGRTARAGRAGISVSLASDRERKIVKDIIKNATHPVKSRIIPSEILERYKNKLEKLEEQIVKILDEEYQERTLNKSENQINRAQNILKGEREPQRSWFQTKKERREEKVRLTINPKQALKSNKRTKSKHPKKKNESKEDRIQSELNKVIMLKAHIAKRNLKSKKIKSCVENTTPQINKKKRKGSNFADDYTDVSKAKVLRHNSKKNQKSGKPGFKAKNKGGKVYGRPTSKKQDRRR